MITDRSDQRLVGCLVSLNFRSGIIVAPRVVTMRMKQKYRAAITLMAFALLLGMGGGLHAQEHGVTPAEIERGGQMFLANCSSCHGPNGDGIAGVSLFSGHFSHATTDQDLVNIIQHGIPGTPMPPFNMPDAQAGAIVAYLRSQPQTNATSIIKGLHGDPANGELIVMGKGGCLACHRLPTPSGEAGGFLGPDLSNIGSTRRSIDLERALTDPGANIRTNERVVVVTKDGATIRGRLLNQDTYSTQLIDGKGDLRSIQKANVRQVNILTTSVMPTFTDKFTKQELADVVSYLMTLKSSPAAGIGRSSYR